MAAVTVDAHRVVEQEDVLQRDDVSLHALDLRDMSYPAAAVFQPGLVHHEIHGGGDLLPDGPHGQIHARHQDHRLEARQGVARRVGVEGRDAAFVPGVHGLKHVERFAPSHLPDHDAVGPHAQGVTDEISDRHLAPPLDVGRSRFELKHVRLTQTQLDRILDRHGALVGGDVGGEDVQRGGLTRPGSSRDDQVELASDTELEELRNRGGESAEGDEVHIGEGLGGKLADRKKRPVDGERVDHCVDSSSVRHPGIDHRRGLVDTPADARHYGVDDTSKVVLVDEAAIRPEELARALHVDLRGTVDHHLGDLGVLEQLLDGAVAEHVGFEVLEQGGPLGRRHRGWLLSQEPRDVIQHELREPVGVQVLLIENGSELLGDAGVETPAQLVELRAHGVEITVPDGHLGARWPGDGLAPQIAEPAGQIRHVGAHDCAGRARAVLINGECAPGWGAESSSASSSSTIRLSARATLVLGLSRATGTPLLIERGTATSLGSSYETGRPSALLTSSAGKPTLELARLSTTRTLSSWRSRWRNRDSASLASLTEVSSRLVTR